MNKKYLSLILGISIILFLPVTMNCQNLFLTTYPTVYDKDSREVINTPDGGYIIAGSTNNSNQYDADLYVMKADVHGNFLWGKTYGGAKPEYAYSMVATSDGNYFVVGYSQSFGGGDFDIYLIKIDPTGTLLWQKTYGGIGNEHGREIIPTSDGNYAIVGTSNSGQTSDQAFLMKIDLAGTVLWTKYYGGDMHEGGNSVKETPTGDFIVNGQTFSYGQTNGSVYLVKTNSTGDTTWTRYYNTGNITSEGTSIVSNPDGSFVFIIRDSSATNDIDARLIKTDSNGNILWNKLYGGNQKDTPKRLRQTSDGGYVASITSRSFGWINPDMWILRFNTIGDTLWSKHFGGPNHEHANDIKQTADGGYVVTGHSKSYGTDGQRIMLVRTDEAGLVGIKINNLDIVNFNLFPNPSSNGKLSLQMQEGISANLKICNPLGQIVFNEPVLFRDKEIKPISLEQNTPGIYLITIYTSEFTVSRKVLIE
jgi:hypothetical protein